MKAPSAGPGNSPWWSVVGPGEVLAGVELEVIIHGDVGGQHFQIQSINILQRAGGSKSVSLGFRPSSITFESPVPEVKSLSFSFLICEMGRIAVPTSRVLGSIK